MSEKSDTERIRIPQVMSGALAAITAAVLGSTMGVAGTVVGAGLASVVTTVGGTLYLRSIHRTRQGVQSVRNLVVTRVGGTDVTLVEERRAEPAPTAGTEVREETEEKATDEAATEAGTEAGTEARADADDQPPERRRIRWPAVIAASVLAFVIGMLVITGVEWLRGAPLSGGEGTTVGGIVRTQQDQRDDPDKAPPATGESTTPPADTSTVTVTPPPATSENEEPGAPETEPTDPETTAPDTTTEAPQEGSESVPQSGAAG
jgi:hypothetical protein